MIAVALLVLMASASAMQQAPAAQDPHAKMPVATLGISAQAANEAAAARLNVVPQDGQALQEKTQDVQDAAQPAPAAPAESKPVGGMQPTPAAASPGVVASAAGNVAERGVLFRIFPPTEVALPAELVVPESVEAGAATPMPGATASTPSAPSAATVAVQARPSYLLGTIHFGTPEEQGVDYATLEKALSEVDAFVNEADIDEAWKTDYDGYRWLPPEQPLSAMISKESYAMARSLLPNIRAQDMVRMKPWSVLALLEARGESGGDTTMDARLQRLAASTGKRLVHLETLKEQLQSLDCVPASEHARVLDERLRAPWILRNESAAAMNHYRSRNLGAWLSDIDHMYGLSYDGKAIEQRSRHCLLEERNARWIGQLETLFQDVPGFVAVGAVHLVGEQGLIAALRRDGYRIEVVPL